MTTALLNAGIEALSGAKEMVEITSAKAVFESAIGILVLVRVRVSPPPPHDIHLSLRNRTRAS